MTNRKLEILSRLLEQVPTELRETPEQATITWWANIRPEGGLRLTDHGYTMMHDILDLESWELDLVDHKKQIFTKKLILSLDRKLEWPYYLDVNPRKKKRRIVFFGSREAMMATMYGDLERWLANIK